MTEYNPKNWYWIVADDSTQVFSSAVGGYVPFDDASYKDWLSSEENVPTRIASMDELIAVLRDANVPPYHHIDKSTVLARLTDAQLSAAIGAMTVRQLERWRAPDKPYVNADDPELMAVLHAVGADLRAVAAP